MVWKRCHLSHQNFPFPGAYGWEVDDEGSFYPNLTNNLPVPLAILEISSCGCKTTTCSDNRCGCKKNDLVCTDLCKCKDCQNFDNSDAGEFIDVRDEYD